MSKKQHIFVCCMLFALFLLVAIRSKIAFDASVGCRMYFSYDCHFVSHKVGVIACQKVVLTKLNMPYIFK